MIVDSSALPEQAVRDIVTAAFQSAGQRCSALRVLFLQSDIADNLLTLLKGAMDELCIGDPWNIETDIGPVIDTEAKDLIEDHCRTMEREGRLIRQVALPGDIAKFGHFVVPAAFRLQDIGELEREIFGPVLHVITFEAENLNDLVDSINASGYGLTMGIQTRVDNRVQDICDRARVGNIYVNRNQIGAVVGAQPFGGEGLSGTGPKAGGPHYLVRFTKSFSRDGRSDEVGAKSGLPSKDPSAKEGDAISQAASTSLSAQKVWDRMPHRRAILAKISEDYSDPVGAAVRGALASLPGFSAEAIDLPGPTGESNRLSVHGRGVFLCLGAGGIGKLGLSQAALALLLGNGAVVVVDDETRGDVELFTDALTEAGAPAGLLSPVGKTPLMAIETAPSLAGVILQGSGDYHRTVRKALAARIGPILPLIDDLSDWRAMLIERALCIDTTASGGNAALLASS